MYLLWIIENCFNDYKSIFPIKIFRNEGKGLSLSETVGSGDVKKGKTKASLNAEFFAKLKKLLKILIPGPFSSEVFYMIVIGFVLLARTIADVYMITNATSVEA